MSPRLHIRNKEDGIFELNIDDPEHENQLSDELLDELRAGLSKLASEPALKVLVVTGGRKIFCAGASLQILRNISTEGALKDLALPAQLLAFPVPILAALEGHAVGGGLVLAICCDIVVAAETSRYSLNFLSMGFTPGMGATFLLPALVGTSFAAEMILTGKFYKGRELQRRGLFSYVVPVDQVLPLTWDLARSIADKPRHLLELAKEAVTNPRRVAFQEAISRESLMHKVCFSHPEARATIESNYLGKR